MGGEQGVAGNETSGDDDFISMTGADAASNASHVVNLTRRRCWFQRRPWNCGRLLAKSNTSSAAITSEGENANGTEELKAGRWGRRWWRWSDSEPPPPYIPVPGGGRRLSNTSSSSITSEGKNASGPEELKAGRWGRRWWGGGRRLGEQEFAGNEPPGDDIIISKAGAD